MAESKQAESPPKDPSELTDRYQIREVIGQGGMGVVYHVRDRRLGEDLAVKRPHRELFESNLATEAFIRECEIWSNIGPYPHIAKYYFVQIIEGTPHVFAEYVESGSLQDWIDSRRLYEGEETDILRRILGIAIDTGWGLQYAHERHVVHQDMKPANILVTPDGMAKITDFGIANAIKSLVLSSNNQTARAVTARGRTQLYCSPEQALSQKLTHKTDIWSWGLTVLTMFAGRPAWSSGVHAQRALTALCGSTHVGIPAIPTTLKTILHSCFQVSPDHRPADLGLIADNLCTLYLEVTGTPYAPRPLGLGKKWTGPLAVESLDSVESAVKLGRMLPASLNYWAKTDSEQWLGSAEKLGISQRYEHPAGAYATLFFYGRQSPNNSTREFNESEGDHLEGLKVDIVRSQRDRKERVASTFTDVRKNCNCIQWHCSFYCAETDWGETNLSWVCVAYWSGYIVKIRATFDASARRKSFIYLDGLVQSFSQFLVDMIEKE